MSFGRDDLLKLLGLLDVTVEDEIDCAEFLQRAAWFVEHYDPQEPAPEGCEALVQHLRVCPECLEEFRFLYDALRAARDPE